MKSARFLLTGALIASMACLPLLGSNGALLSGVSGAVTVNQRALAVNSAILAGDVVTTNAGSAARLVLPGINLLAAANTSFQLETAGVRLQYGALSVTGAFPVAVNAYELVPAAGSRFLVGRAVGASTLDVEAGSVSLRHAGASVTVPAGHSVSFDNGASQTAAGAGGGGVDLTALIGVVAVAGVALGTAFALRSNGAASASQ